MWLFLFNFHCPRSLKMGDIALRTAQKFGVRKVICWGATLSAFSGDFVLVRQVLSPPRPCLQPAIVMSGLSYHSENKGWRNWGEIVQAMRIVWFTTCKFLKMCLWASWSEFYKCWERVLSTFFHLLSSSQTRKAWYKSFIHLKANNSWEKSTNLS